MRRRTFLGGTLAGVVLALMLAGTIAAQEDDQTPAADAQPVSTDANAPVPPPALFLNVTDPADALEVPLSTTAVGLRGQTVPEAIVSVDGELVDLDDQGTFTALVSLDEGANAIDVVASTQDGSIVDTTILVIRGAD